MNQISESSQLLIRFLKLSVIVGGIVTMKETQQWRWQMIAIVAMEQWWRRRQCSIVGGNDDNCNGNKSGGMMVVVKGVKASYDGGNSDDGVVGRQ